MVAPMHTGFAVLVTAYVLSQFYRAFLAVLSPWLAADIGTTPADLADASGLWFLAFALMQLPVGMALDRIGPRDTAAALLAVGAAGAGLFAAAAGPLGIKVAMTLIGMGCAPVLMAAYFILARSARPAVFATLAGMVIGVGSLGNIAAALPLAWAAETFGWRSTVAAIAALTLAVALALRLTVQNPPRLANHADGSLLDLLRMPALWPVLAMMAVCYAPAAGIRGLWVGPYYAQVFGADAGGIGTASLILGLAMVAGNFAYGPMDRVLGTRKGLILGGNLIVAACLLGLGLFPAAGGWMTLLLLAGVGFFGASFPMVIAHGRAFFPPHLTGRGVTLLNLFGIGAVGVLQVATGALYAAIPGPPPTAPFAAVFLLFAAVLLAGLAIYAFSTDRTD
jgi:predicted MFS family arabinose efflux permease